MVACVNQSQISRLKDKPPQILTIYPDGSMVFNDRFVNQDDIVIYPDGFGGEQAAIILFNVPYHPEFYRDSIQVYRINDEGEYFLKN